MAVSRSPALNIGSGYKGWSSVLLSGPIQFASADVSCGGNVRYYSSVVNGLSTFMSGVTPSGNLIASSASNYSITSVGNQCTPYPGVPMADPGWNMAANGMQWAPNISPSVSDWYTDTSTPASVSIPGTGSGYVDGAKYMFTNGCLYQMFDGLARREPPPNNFYSAPVVVVQTSIGSPVSEVSAGTHTQGTYGYVWIDSGPVMKWTTSQDPRDWSGSVTTVAIPSFSMVNPKTVALTNPYGSVIVGLVWDELVTGSIYAIRSYDGGGHWNIDSVPVAAFPSSMDNPPKLVSSNKFVYAAWIDSSYNIQSVCSTDAGLTWS